MDVQLELFEFLNQEGMNREEGIRLIKDFEKSSRYNHTAWNPILYFENNQLGSFLYF